MNFSNDPSLLERRTVEHLGKTWKCSCWYPLTDEQCDALREYYYAKPDFEEVKKELVGIYQGKVAKGKISRYYLRDLIIKTRTHHSRWSVEEALECNDIIRCFYGRCIKSPNTYCMDNTVFGNFEQSLRIGGKGYAAKVGEFPIKTVKEVLLKYNINGNYCDPSCGWGDRLLGSLSLGINYYGTDPNYLLVDRLNQIAKDYKENTKSPLRKLMNSSHENIVDIRSQGSEIFIPEWENKMGVVFTSPPYFKLEDYKIGNQSCNSDSTIGDWVNDYYRPTIENIDRYLVEDGHVAINIKNYNTSYSYPNCGINHYIEEMEKHPRWVLKKRSVNVAYDFCAEYDLVGITKDLMRECGYTQVDSIPLKVKSRKTRNQYRDGILKTDNSEDIMVFKKKS